MFTSLKVFMDLCSREKMVENYGQKVIRLSSANTHSYKKGMTSRERLTVALDL